jgi:hypothetical protein
MTDVLLGMGALMVLVVYSSIAVAIYQFTGDRLATRLHRFQAIVGLLIAYGAMLVLLMSMHFAPEARGHPPAAFVAPAMFGGIGVMLGTGFMAVTDYDNAIEGVRAATWLWGLPVAWLCLGAAKGVALGVRVPVKLGMWLSGNGGARHEYQSSVAERIAELERELGIGRDGSDVLR